MALYAENSYITEDDMRRYSFQPALNELDFVNDAIPKICELIDLYVGVPTNFFAKVESSVPASGRIFYGDGSARLRVEPYIAGTLSGTITVPSGITAPSFVEIRPDTGRFQQSGNRLDYLLEIVDSRGFLQSGYQFGNRAPLGGSVWIAGCPYTLTARWGFAAVPETIKQAVIETMIAMNRDKDQAFARAVNLDTNIANNVDAIPKRAKMILDGWRNRIAFA